MTLFYVTFGYTFPLDVQDQVKLKLVFIKDNLLLFIKVSWISSGFWNPLQSLSVLLFVSVNRMSHGLCLTNCFLWHHGKHFSSSDCHLSHLMWCSHSLGQDVLWLIRIVGHCWKGSSMFVSWLTLEAQGQHVGCPLSPDTFLALVSKPQLLNTQKKRTLTLLV